jgi:hypothetical protein
MGAVARIAGLLHLAEHGGEAARHPITEETMRRALILGEYYIGHALAVFDLMGADHSLDSARSVLAHLHAHQVTEITVRDLFTALSRTRFPKVGEVVEALSVLAEYGWVQRMPSPERGSRGRPPSPRYRVIPPPPQ